MVFVKKSTFFSYVFFGQKKPKKTFFHILDSKECFLNLKSEVLKKSKKSTFCKGFSPWFLSKNRPFSHMFFLSKKSQKETFFHILDRKEWFLDHKRKVLKNSKKSTFSNGVTPWFLSKTDLFLICFFLSKQTQKETFIDLLDRNKCFLDVKNEVLKKVKKIDILKRG